MKRKLVAFVLVFALLASLSPAVAADEMSAPPTVEEILNEYHQKAFEAKMQGDTGNASAWSLRGGQPLEEETVDALTEAGYEAYNVTADNYESLQTELKTDFSDMGLDPNGSYIIVISGEDPTEPASTGGASTYNLNPLPGEDQAPDGGPSGFNYTYNGQTYWMRYVTVTSTTGSNMSVDSTYNLLSSVWYEDALMDIFSTTLVSAVDKMAAIGTETIPLGTIASLLFNWATDDNYTELEPGTLTIHATTAWTAKSIQVWNSIKENWKTAQSSAYAISRAKCVGYVYNPNINDSTWYDGIEHSATRYSPKYYETAQRLSDAVCGYNDGFIYYDRTEDIEFYLGNETGEIIYNADSGPLFVHTEWWGVPEYS